MRTEQVDVIVIGGGPAGAAFATITARAGLQVRVLEGTKFPRHHIGESLLAMSMPLLGTLGVLEDLDSAGFLRKTGAVFVWGEKHRRLDLEFPAPHRAYQVYRSEFDTLLLNHAANSGAAVWQQQWARSTSAAADSRMSTVVSDGAHGRTEHRARVVVDASGLFQFTPRRLGSAQRLSGPHRVAVSGYYTGADRVSGYQAPNVISEASRDGWLWFIPLDANTTSIGFVGDAADLKLSPAQTLTDQIGTTELIAALLRSASSARAPRLLRYTNHIVADPLWRDGRVLIGDTAFFVDPLFSTGVHGALYSGISAASAAVSFLNDGLPEHELADWYDRRMRAHYERVQTMVRLLYGINGTDSRFWSSRDLRHMSGAQARTIARALGPISVPLFRTGQQTNTLDLPPALVPLLSEFSTDPDPTCTVAAERIVLGHNIQITRTLVRRGDHLVPAVGLVDPENRRPSVEVPDSSVAARLIGRLAHGPVTRSEWCADSRLAALVSVLHSGQLVQEDMSADSEGCTH
ncbi:NAD(P)/FAD-dependent oxidoreductase [Nocardia sp. NPDC051052]|uniref:NAD(P)/FAD-dependent oxidoreductase n=1 Tax=Nocardia sp. NPDC051052 TaxID=3364322 RepID=UPI00378DCB75